MALQDLPGYIHFPLSDLNLLGEHDRRELEQCNGLGIPSPGLRNHILRGFAESVYPQLPVVNLHQIVTAIDGTGSEHVSLLLFQAIMFTGVSYVPLEHLQQYGYISHIAAQRDFYRRVESCFNATLHAGLAGPVVLIQAALLLTLRYDLSDTTKEGHFWMRAVVALSNDIGMHRGAPHVHSARDPAATKLWRRIAWATYARDRVILLSARCPALIRATDFTLAPLTLDDFELQPIHSVGLSCLHHDCTLFRDSRQLREMASLCLEQIHLALCIDAVFTPQENMSSSPSFAPGLAAGDAKLKAWWLECIDKGMRFDKHMPDLIPSNQRSTIVQRLVLLLTYDTIISALHRPLVLRGTLDPDTAPNDRTLESCKVFLNYATQDITKLAGYLYSHDLSLFLPASVVTALLSALIVHMSMSRATDEDLKSTSLSGFRQCLLLLDRLRPRHGNAEDVYQFLERTINSASTDSQGNDSEVSELSPIFEKVKHEAASFVHEEQQQSPVTFGFEPADIPNDHHQQDIAFAWPADDDPMFSDLLALGDAELGYLPDSGFDPALDINLDAMFADETP